MVQKLPAGHQDVAIGLAVAAILYFSGGSGTTFVKSLTAVLSAAGGAAITSGIQAHIKGGDFWSNFEANFHFNFRLAAAFLAVSGVLAFGKGVANGTGFQGYVADTSGAGGAISFSSATYFGESPNTLMREGLLKGVATVAEHEFGRYIQYTIIMAVGANGPVRMESLALLYLGIGALDGAAVYKGASSPWYNVATWLGAR